MNKLPRLKKGDTIALLCPASYKDPKSENSLRGIKYLEDLGYKVKLYPSYGSYLNGYLAGSDGIRTQDLMDAFSDKSVKAIICARGGYGASRILDKLDYDIIKENPKLFMGYSDITVLLNTLRVRCGFPTVHGDMNCSFGSLNFDKEISQDDFNDLLNANQKGRILPNPKYNFKLENNGFSGSVSGEIVGGNLSLICNLQGTPYEIDTKDKILFIEEVEESPYSLDRYFTNLRLSHKLDDAKGIIFGYFTGTKNDPDGKETRRILDEFCKDLKKPVLYGFPSGHDYPFVNVPIGLKVNLNTQTNEIIIEEEMYDETY